MVKKTTSAKWTMNASASRCRRKMNGDSNPRSEQRIYKSRNLATVLLGWLSVSIM